MRATYIFVNGIFTVAETSLGKWTEAAAQWIDRNTEDSAEQFSYWCDVLFRRLLQQKRARELAKILETWDGRRIVLVGHSNGCDLICRALKLTSVKVAEVHLFAGAVDSSFTKNGLNEAIRQERVGGLFIYSSASDEALRIAGLSQVFSWLGLGYGNLGLTGPKDATDLAKEHTKEVRRDSYGHSDWFLAANFDSTMRMISSKLP